MIRLAHCTLIFFSLKFGRSEKGTKFEKIFDLEFDATEQRQILSGRFFQILCQFQNVQTLKGQVQPTIGYTCQVVKLYHLRSNEGILIGYL